MFSTAMTYCPIEKNRISTTLSARQVSLLFIPNADSLSRSSANISQKYPESSKVSVSPQIVQHEITRLNK